MNVLRAAIFTLVILVQTEAWAECSSTSCKSTITKLFTTTVGGEGRAFIRVNETPAEIAKLNCTAGEGDYIVLKSSHIMFKELYANLLSAGASKATLGLRIHERPGQPCELAYIVYNF